MGMDKLTRRQMVGMVGAAAALASSGQAVAGQLARPARGPSAPPAPSGVSLVAPLALGSQLGAWRVVGIVGARAGAVTIGLESDATKRFFLDVCLRDDNGPTPPARTTRCDIFVANEGNGAVPTVEDQGLAALAVAELVRANENGCDLSGLMTQRARLAAFGDSVLRGLD
jgi:hypothetical protein